MQSDVILAAMSEHLLYHYTNAEGLDGILKSNSLWASAVEYMNDATEFRYAMNLVKEQMTAAVESQPEGATKMLLRGLRDVALRPFSELQLFACCFCGKGDLLSMWRGYGSGGYAIGFIADSLRAIPMVYERGRQVKIMSDLLERIDKKWGWTFVELDKKVTRGEAQKEELETLIGEMADDFIFTVGTQILSFKDKAFAEEMEWRVIKLARKYPDGLDQMNYRLGVFGFVPYVIIDRIRLGQGEHQGLLPIEEVIAGPSAHPELTERGLRLALDKNGYAHVKIAPSTVPLRVMAPSSAKV